LINFLRFVIQKLYHHFARACVGIILQFTKEKRLNSRKAGARLINLPPIFS